jgi:hydrogenase maturation protein HypF
MIRTRLRVTGTVQGVGFRPFVYRHAQSLGLTGFVLNDSAGVLIEIEGEADDVAEMERVLVAEAPPLARVASVVAEPIAPANGAERGFRIVDSDGAGAAAVPVSVDTATCSACLAEVDDPSDRRYRYPFTNCTDCGPRYTIVLSVPYDRPATTMARFTMCAACQAEYDDPTDRRFHAQPNACPRCGPQLAFGDHRGEPALCAAVDALQAGKVIAVKGLGGYHLAVDATNAAAVSELRRRKARDDKPFAVMVRDVDEARGICDLGRDAVDALTSNRRPIVLAPRLDGAPIAPGVAPGLPDLGLMLPYTALHHLLVRDVGRPLVMTSGNVSDEPIAHEDVDARTRLGPLVDGILGHDRAVHIRCDDSVVRATGAETRMLRRSRGYAPEPLALAIAARRHVLAVGAELKSTISVAKDRMVVPSHHIGDLEHLATYRSFLQALDHLRALYGITPEVVAHDLHPEYLSTKLAIDLDLEPVAVQHHHAHVASCMVDHGRVEPVLALAFDGLGFGADGTLWGGEFLVADLAGFERVAHLRPVTMPGGAAAIREPWRMAVAWGAERDEVMAHVPGPTTTSMGRLFDAVASVIVGRRQVTYEAQAAIELEALARSVDRRDAPVYSDTVVVDDDTLDPTALVSTVVVQRERGVAAPVVAAGFHETIGRAAAALGARLAARHGLDTVVLTGGVFQNERLTEIVESALARGGLDVLTHHSIPPNDGGISIGQAAVAAARDAQP